MKKFFLTILIFLLVVLTACSGQKASDIVDSTDNAQAESIVMLEEGVWPDNQYTENLPVPPGTVSRAMLDTCLLYTSGTKRRKLTSSSFWGICYIMVPATTYRKDMHQSR